MAGKSVIIIGAGIGGLAAGCYARLAGLDAHIVEMHTLPGGLCTAWTRHGYTFDGSIHHLAGCHPESPLYALWEELGAMPRDVLFPEHLSQVEAPDGRTFSVFVDPDRLEDHMLDSFPEDRRFIRRYLAAIRGLRRYDLLETCVRSRTGLLRYVPAARHMLGWGSLTMAQAADRLRDSFLRRAFPAIQYDWPEIPVLIHLNMLAQCARRNYGFPVGGSLSFSRSIAARFEELGGRITYGERVKRIITDGDRAIGVRLDRGDEIPADAVVSNAFAHTTLFEMLDSKHLDAGSRAEHARVDHEMIMGVHVSLGVARDLSNEPRALVLLRDEPIRLGDRDLDRLPVEVYGFDDTLAPMGKGVIKVLLNTDYRYWADLAADRARYDEAKGVLADVVVRAIEPRFPGLSDQIEVADVATPLSTERFTGVGPSYTSQKGGPSLAAILGAAPKRLPALRNVLLIGQSVGAGGIPGCAAMGRNAIRALCRAWRLPFPIRT